MRALYIIAIVVSLIFAIGCIIIAGQVASYRTLSIFNSNYNDYMSGSSYDSGYSMYDSYRTEAHAMTTTGGVFSLLCLAFFVTLYILTLVKLKTKTMKVLSIIGLCLSGICMLVSFLPITSPGGVSFDEIGGLFVFMAVINLAFSIIGTVHAFRRKTPAPAPILFS
jgi:hypothetical protein